jgi:hypothetical protein
MLTMKSCDKHGQLYLPYEFYHLIDNFFHFTAILTPSEAQHSQLQFEPFAAFILFDSIAMESQAYKRLRIPYHSVIRSRFDKPNIALYILCISSQLLLQLYRASNWWILHYPVVPNKVPPSHSCSFSVNEKVDTFCLNHTYLPILW